MSTGIVELPALRTARLLLEPITVEHASELATALRDDSVYAFIGGRPEPASWWQCRLAAWQRRRSPDGTELWLNWAVRITANMMVIGYVQTTVAEQQADIAYVIGLPWQRQGYGREATAAMVDYVVAEFGIATVRAWIADGHIASQRVAQATGLAASDERDADQERLWIREMPPIADPPSPV
ncbi:MAG TPA: GNAT family N-acetyltransferase [Jatrophihabitans sp.]|nr:GNAT family N-acetyltransferase [Jatrophihabitans sp.]